jgi:hypothetical protein
MVSSLSVYLAQVWGISLIIMCLALFNKRTREDLLGLGERGLALVGLMTLGIGAAMVVGHNVWIGWPIIITLIGWVSLLKGICLLFFPNSLLKIYQKMLGHNWIYVSAVIGVILGLVLIYLGYAAGV